MRLPGVDSNSLAAALNEAGVIVSGRRDFVRFSPHLYNEPRDIAYALARLDQILA